MDRWTLFHSCDSNGANWSKQDSCFSLGVMCDLIVQIFSKACCKSCVRSLHLKLTGFCVCRAHAVRGLWGVMASGISFQRTFFFSFQRTFFRLNTFCIFDRLHNLSIFFFLSLDRIRKQAVLHLGRSCRCLTAGQVCRCPTRAVGPTSAPARPGAVSAGFSRIYPRAASSRCRRALYSPRWPPHRAGHNPLIQSGRSDAGLDKLADTHAAQPACARVTGGWQVGDRWLTAAPAAPMRIPAPGQPRRPLTPAPPALPAACRRRSEASGGRRGWGR